MAPIINGKNAEQIRGVEIDKTPPTNGQLLKYVSATGKLAYSSDTSGVGGSSGTVGDAIILADGTGGVTVKSSNMTVETTLTDDDTKVPTSGAVSDALAGKFSTTGDITLADGKSVQLNKTLAADHAYSGVVVSLTAATATTIFQVGYLNSVGKVALASNAASATMPVVAMAAATIGEDAAGVYLLSGVVRDDTWNWTAGGAIYVSTAGGLTQAAPTGTGKVVQVVGWALTADTMVFNPSNTWLELT